MRHGVAFTKATSRRIPRQLDFAAHNAGHVDSNRQSQRAIKCRELAATTSDVSRNDRVPHRRRGGGAEVMMAHKRGKVAWCTGGVKAPMSATSLR